MSSSTISLIQQVVSTRAALASRRLALQSAGARSTSCSENAARDAFLRSFQQSDGPSARDAVYSLSYATDSLEEDFGSDDLSPLLDDRQRRQIRKSCDALKFNNDTQTSQPLLNRQVRRQLPPSEQDSMPLPRTVDEITQFALDRDPRALVITDTTNPRNIVTVNTAWEKLCGYRRSECEGESLGSLLQGPETDTSKATELFAALLSGEEAGSVLTNYTKRGDKFLNKVRVGPVVNDSGKTTHFVGALSEVE